MYISFSGKNKEFATAIIEKVINGKREKILSKYLGKIVNFIPGEKITCYSKTNGYTIYNYKTSQFEEIRSNEFQHVETKDHIDDVRIDGGDSYIIFQYLYKCGYIDVIISLNYENIDTLLVVIIASILQINSSEMIKIWYNNNIIKYLCPNADIKNSSITKCYEFIGLASTEQKLHINHASYLFKRCQLSNNGLLDSTGLKNDIDIYYTQLSIHNNCREICSRLTVLTEHKTGIPFYFRLVPGNIIDKVTLKTTLRHLDALGIKVNNLIMDSGYYSKENIDSFYDDNHNCKTDYVLKVYSNNKLVSSFLSEEYLIMHKQDIYFYNGRVYRIFEKEVKVGKNNDNIAYLYIILDYNSYISSFKTLIDKAVENSYSTEEFNKSFEKIAVFAILSSKKIGCDRILLVYFIRLNIEQTFDFMKNYTNLLPLRVHTELAVRGRATVCYMSTCLLRMLQIELRSSDCNLGSNIHDLKNQKFCIYSHKIVVEDIIPEFRSMCNKLNIIIPEEFELDGKKVKINISKDESLPVWARVVQSKSFDICETPKEKKEKKSKRNKSQKESINKPSSREMYEEQVSVKSGKPVLKKIAGRPKGRRNNITIERERLVWVLTALLGKKCAQEGVSEAELLEMLNDIEHDRCEKDHSGQKKRKHNREKSGHDIIAKKDILDVNSGENTLNPQSYEQKQNHYPGRRKGSKNRSTLIKETINQYIDDMLNSICAELNVDLSKIRELIKNTEEREEKEVVVKKVGRRIGSKKQVTLDNEFKYNIMVNLISERSKELNISNDEYRNLLYIKSHNIRNKL